MVRAQNFLPFSLNMQINNGLVATAITTAQSNGMIGWMTANNRAARPARTLEHFLDVD